MIPTISFSQNSDEFSKSAKTVSEAEVLKHLEGSESGERFELAQDADDKRSGQAASRKSGRRGIQVLLISNFLNDGVFDDGGVSPTDRAAPRRSSGGGIRKKDWELAAPPHGSSEDEFGRRRRTLRCVKKLKEEKRTGICGLEGGWLKP